MPDNLKQAARLIVESTYVTALVGSGLSAESGIPTFRGQGGLWTRFGEPPMNGFQRFTSDPETWWREQEEQNDDPARSEFREAIDNARPNPGHYALADLEQSGVLKSIITQNIDNLHSEAGSTAITEIHGNRTKLRCIGCEGRWPREEFIIDAYPPRCVECDGLIKSDTVMFGEPIPPGVLSACHRETDLSDCMLAIGTSAAVYPAANFPRHVKASGGILIEVNTDDTPLSSQADVVLRGPSGELLPKLVRRIAEIHGMAG